MKKNQVVDQRLAQIVLMVPDKTTSETLLTPVLGQTLLVRQMQQLARLPLTTITWLIPTAADDLRQAIRAEAVKYPVRVETINLLPKYPVYHTLVQERGQLNSKFLLTIATNMDAVFYFRQLQDWQAEVVLTGRERPYRHNWGSGQRRQKFVTTVSKQMIKNWWALLPAMMIGQKFLESLTAVVVTEAEWWAGLDRWAREQVVKWCEVEGEVDETLLMGKLPRTRRDMASWCQRWLEAGTAGIDPSAQIAPTTRMRGAVIMEAGVKVGEFGVIEGPVYLGRGVQVGNYVELGPDVYLEAGVSVASRTSLTEVRQTAVESK
jgi:hypothetical protein